LGLIALGGVIVGGIAGTVVGLRGIHRGLGLVVSFGGVFVILFAVDVVIGVLTGGSPRGELATGGVVLGGIPLSLAYFAAVAVTRRLKGSPEKPRHEAAP